MLNQFLQTAETLRAQGFSVIPTSKDKIPRCAWKEFQGRLPTEKEIKTWFSKPEGMALLGGSILCLDFDEKHAKGIFPRFLKRADETGLGFILGELIRQKTPSGGFHLVMRCEGKRVGNLKLANCKSADGKALSMIETRGEGGYFLIAPSPGYALEHGDWSAIPLISEDDRDALLNLARTFDESDHAEAHEPAPSTGELTPGDDYDARADIPALLKAHGWRLAGMSGKYWTRPGKPHGISATWDVVPQRFYCFTSSTDFQQNHVYRPWHVYAVLECGGDFSRAAAELRRQGFGGLRKPAASQEYGPGDPPAIEGIDPMGDAPTVESEDDKIRRLLRARAFDQSKEPPPLRPTFSLGETVIATPGNLCAITAQAKVGKSALVSALVAASMTAPDSAADCLSAVGYNLKKHGLLYFDTEQSPDDFWHAVNRARRRAKADSLPSWISAHTIADLPAKVARKAVSVAMADAHEAHGGIHAVIIDGIADLVLDVNDAEECNGIVAELHAQAIRYDCSIILVIHKNPGSDKVRGHLGSQIERKAETNLSLEKEDEVTVIWSSKQRRAPISKKDGPRFRWDDDLRMHVTCSAENKTTAKIKDLWELAASVLKPGQRTSWSDLVGALQDARQEPSGKRPSTKTAQRWISEMRNANIIEANFGAYSLTQAAQQ